MKYSEILKTPEYSEFYKYLINYIKDKFPETEDPDKFIDEMTYEKIFEIWLNYNGLFGFSGTVYLE